MANEKIITTLYGGKETIPPSVRKKICLNIDGQCFVDENALGDNDVIQLITLWKASGDLKEMHYESSAEIESRYSEIDRTALNASMVQREIKSIFDYCVSLGGSDLHIAVRDNESVVKARFLGDLSRLYNFSSEKGNSICRTIYTTMCDSADKNFQPKKPQGGRISSAYLPDQLSGARVATTPTDNGYYMVCRLLYKPKDKNPTLEQLGYEKFHIEDLARLTAKTAGITIISGPTGSGKSTTLQVVISSLITEADGKSHVITVEDPPEYSIFGWENSKQKIFNSDGTIKMQLLVDENGSPIRDEHGNEQYVEELGKKIKSFATQTPVNNARGKEQRTEKMNEQISAAMRLDPEVIMIGEVRDAASAGAAVQAALTGHQVFTTVHANNALTIFPRLIDIGAKRELVCDADVVVGLIAQRLTKKLCKHCSKPLLENLDTFCETPNGLASLKRLLVSFGAYESIDDIKNNNDYHGLVKNATQHSIDLTGVRMRSKTGCGACNNTGLSGRSVVAEIIVTDHNYMQLVLQDKKAELQEYWLKELNGVDMCMHGLLKIKQGTADVGEMEREIGHIELNEFTNLIHLQKLLKETELPTCQRMIEDKVYAEDFRVKFPELFVNVEKMSLDSKKTRTRKPKTV